MRRYTEIPGRGGQIERGVIVKRKGKGRHSNVSTNFIKPEVPREGIPLAKLGTLAEDIERQRLEQEEAERRKEQRRVERRKSY